jgi:hypothetical protein
MTNSRRSAEVSHLRCMTGDSEMTGDEELGLKRLSAQWTSGYGRCGGNNEVCVTVCGAAMKVGKSRTHTRKLTGRFILANCGIKKSNVLERHRSSKDEKP